MYVCCSVVACLLLSVQMIPLTELTNKESEDLVPSFAQSLHIRFYHSHVSHGYGLFRRMTGVGGRPEIIIQGTITRKLNTRKLNTFNNSDIYFTCIFLVEFSCVEFPCVEFSVPPRNTNQWEAQILVGCNLAEYPLDRKNKRFHLAEKN